MSLQAAQIHTLIIDEAVTETQTDWEEGKYYFNKYYNSCQAEWRFLMLHSKNTQRLFLPPSLCAGATLTGTVRTPVCHQAAIWIQNIIISCANYFIILFFSFTCGNGVFSCVTIDVRTRSSHTIHHHQAINQPTKYIMSHLNNENQREKIIWNN